MTNDKRHTRTDRLKYKQRIRQISPEERQMNTEKE